MVNVLQGKLGTANIPSIERAMRAAYAEANPGINADDMIVTVEIVDDTLQDQYGYVYYVVIGR